jgi:hypothetical protein
MLIYLWNIYYAYILETSEKALLSSTFCCFHRFKSVNTKIIARFPSSLFFVIIKRDFITDDYLNVPAFTSEFLVRALINSETIRVGL